MLLNAHIFKRRSRGDREEVRIKLFNLDGSPYSPGGGEAVDPVYAQLGWIFADPDFAPHDAALDIADASQQSVMVGLAPDSVDAWKLPVPAGIYLISASFGVGYQEGDEPTYVAWMANFNYEDGSEAIPPSPFAVQAGVSSHGAEGTEIAITPETISRTGWVIMAEDGYLQFVISQDSDTLDNGFYFSLVRVSSL